MRLTLFMFFLFYLKSAYINCMRLSCTCTQMRPCINIGSNMMTRRLDFAKIRNRFYNYQTLVSFVKRLSFLYTWYHTQIVSENSKCTTFHISEGLNRYIYRTQFLSTCIWCPKKNCNVYDILVSKAFSWTKTQFNILNHLCQCNIIKFDYL